MTLTGLSPVPNKLEDGEPSPYEIRIYTGRDLIAHSILHELRTVINAAYQDHDINPLGEVGERLQYDAQIVDEIGPNGLTVVMSTSDEIVGTASVKDWKADADGILWKPGGYYTGKSADAASLVESSSVPEFAACDGDVELFVVAVKPGQQYRKKGIAERLVRACEQELKRKFAAETAQVRIMLRVVREINGQYWLKKGYRTVGEHACPPSTWGLEKAFILWAMRKDICMGDNP